jgi:hypothetical protein
MKKYILKSLRVYAQQAHGAAANALMYSNSLESDVHHASNIEKIKYIGYNTIQVSAMSRLISTQMAQLLNS